MLNDQTLPIGLVRCDSVSCLALFLVTATRLLASEIIDIYVYRPSTAYSLAPDCERHAIVTSENDSFFSENASDQRPNAAGINSEHIKKNLLSY